MTKVPEKYRNREQTYVKHCLLQTYLERLFMIIGQSQSIIRYVDCFSGPWNEQDENLQDTSIGISIETMRKCRDGLKRMGKEVAFEALFIEKNKQAFQKLQSHLKSDMSPNINATALNGEFYELREKILDWCGQNDFTFFFIDPKGWKKVVEIPTLEMLLKRPNSEFLINFMYDFLLRTHPQESFQDDMREIFGEIPETEGMAPEQKESHLIKLYRRNLKRIAPSRGGVPRTAHVAVLYPVRDRSLYHLVYLTRHAKGIQVFMEASEKLEIVQKKARAQAKQEYRETRTHQIEMFPAETDIVPDNKIGLEEVKSYWLKKLTVTPFQLGIDQLADMLEDTGWFESDFQAAFGELAKQGIVANLDDKTNRRTKKFVHFHANSNQGEYLIRLKA
ncbi:MAG: three-Cys-motif partner protein TcmP [Proteobacteria bacterium]|nr:three-Cys-motif partner protein TcmP [Pseudomonadota bacterium]MBU4469087.1 three-Cys-motif partner protein TcmP [Pseudomonadota bacterium]MCG2751059.1 three-Cys-motif partner protein TcmP [Desulfobacteraceae bacterium]